jgi:DNA-binding response OmpR family regulator
MVLDEDVEMRRFLRIWLESHGHEVAFDAGSGHVGLAAIAREPELFDVVISDLRLPIADGLEVLAGARALAGPRGPVPVILASRNWTEEEVALARGLGVAAALVKPIDLARLAAEIALATGRAQYEKAA